MRRVLIMWSVAYKGTRCFFLLSFNVKAMNELLLIPVLTGGFTCNPPENLIKKFNILKSALKGNVNNLKICTFQKTAGFVNAELLHIVGEGYTCNFGEKSAEIALADKRLHGNIFKSQV